MTRLSRRLFNILSLLTIILLVVSAWSLPDYKAQAREQAASPLAQVNELLVKMTPEERVGQLFLVAFNSSEAPSDSQIVDLVANRYIGGVVLLAENDNIIDNQSPAATVGQVLALNHQLQQANWDGSQKPQSDPVTGESTPRAYVPLFIGISQEGDGYPYDQILSGLTPVPNLMALGATWNRELAAQIGAVLGKELSILGINLLFGPSLDVLEAPEVGLANNLGTRTFGGDPYWVGEMGRAYIRGVHQGSQGHIAVVAKHFPGQGSSDRLPEEEVATVRKSLEQLASFDLMPFLTVTGNAISPEETSDALLTSHIRYQGLQGNIRATTRPVSFDPQAFELLMTLPALQTWRINGGVMVSNDLSSRAVRRFYNLTSQTFDARRVALNTFLAGNDLLFIADFSSPEDPDSYAGTLRTLAFFAQKYREDSAFAQRVDASVLRLLSLKYRLYPQFDLEEVLAPTGDLEALGDAGQVTFEVARQAATLISPSRAELESTIPDPPDLTDRIVFISDVRTAQQCSTCPPQFLMDVDDLQSAVIRLYGPQTGGQISIRNLVSYSLDDLEKMLEGSQEQLAIEMDLNRANWIVFGMLSSRDEAPSYRTLSRFLNERPDLLQQKRLIVFAFCAPYYLDATNISLLTAYYALYSKTPQFIDIAAYLLFKELQPIGFSPVSISGIGYDLNEALFPNPSLEIPLELDFPVPVITDTTITLTPAPPPEFRLGDVIPVRAGAILDYNGHPVPDGTPVSFIFSTGGEATAVRQVVNARDGVARTTFAVSSPGTLEIRAESENARSNSLKFDIPTPGGEVPTAIPTEKSTQAPSPTPIILITPGTTPEPPPSPDQPGFGEWLLACLVAGLLGWAVYQLAMRRGQARWGVRTGFMALIGGLAAYTYLAIGLPGSQNILAESILWGVILSSMVGTIMGVLATLAWRAVSEALRRRASQEEKN